MLKYYLVYPYVGNVDRFVLKSMVIPICKKKDQHIYSFYFFYQASTLSPLDQTLVDREFPETRRLLKCLNPKLLSLIADQKGK